VENAAATNAQRGGDTGAASMRDATSKNVKRVRARGEIEQDPGRDEQSEIVDSKHSLETEMLKWWRRFVSSSVLR
jgi:hypothetical protein